MRWQLLVVAATHRPPRFTLSLPCSPCRHPSFGKLARARELLLLAASAFTSSRTFRRSLPGPISFFQGAQGRSSCVEFSRGRHQTIPSYPEEAFGGLQTVTLRKQLYWIALCWGKRRTMLMKSLTDTVTNNRRIEIKVKNKALQLKTWSDLPA
ncbi:uncharacterized protein LOC129309007 isoform X2 [Prosopis cineraria]|uniref:uncharacterized protein LOC129309007 isoform X2 n=1 Tax=Prosopis cineraria TaxID=364024 RepID=UPI00240ECB4A|nr:uncharacterized protein LOC129309007 isoform X2 [Prosopis cineraria]